MHFFARSIVLASVMIMTLQTITASPVNIQGDDVDESLINIDDIPMDGGLGAPMAASVLAPTVRKSGDNYTWEFTDLSVQSTGPFGVTQDSWGTKLPNMNRLWTTDPLDPTKIVMRVNYPKGTSTPGSRANPPNVVGGVGFYAQPISPSVLATAKTVDLEYSVYFPPDFDFGRGGKLPGLYGGDGRTKGCSGGNESGDCFSLNLMWQKLGAGEGYIYRPKSVIPDPAYCKLPPYSFCDANYGDSIGRGAFYFKPGTWTKLRQQIIVNDVPGQATGTMRIWADDKLVVEFKKMVWRTSNIVATQGISFQTFFSGSTPDWATPKDQYTLYKGFKMSASS